MSLLRSYDLWSCSFTGANAPAYNHCQSYGLPWLLIWVPPLLASLARNSDSVHCLKNILTSVVSACVKGYLLPRGESINKFVNNKLQTCWNEEAQVANLRQRKKKLRTRTQESFSKALCLCVLAFISSSRACERFPQKNLVS